MSSNTAQTSAAKAGPGGLVDMEGRWVWVDSEGVARVQTNPAAANTAGILLRGAEEGKTVWLTYVGRHGDFKGGSLIEPFDFVGSDDEGQVIRATGATRVLGRYVPDMMASGGMLDATSAGTSHGVHIFAGAPSELQVVYAEMNSPGNQWSGLGAVAPLGTASVEADFTQTPGFAQFTCNRDGVYRLKTRYRGGQSSGGNRAEVRSRFRINGANVVPSVGSDYSRNENDGYYNLISEAPRVSVSEGDILEVWLDSDQLGYIFDLYDEGNWVEILRHA